MTESARGASSRVIKVAAVGAIVSQLCACVGLAAGVIGNDESRTTNPALFAGHAVEDRWLTPEAKLKPELRADDLLRLWGQPSDRAAFGNGGERWRYNFGLRWNGVLLWALLIPVPLMAPVGMEYVEFEIQDGWVTKAETKEHNAIASYGCIYFLIPVHGVTSACDFGKDSERNSRFYWGGRPPNGFSD